MSLKAKARCFANRTWTWLGLFWRSWDPGQAFAAHCHGPGVGWFAECWAVEVLFLQDCLVKFSSDTHLAGPDLLWTHPRDGPGRSVGIWEENHHRWDRKGSHLWQSESCWFLNGFEEARKSCFRLALLPNPGDSSDFLLFANTPTRPEKNLQLFWFGCPWNTWLHHSTSLKKNVHHLILVHQLHESFYYATADGRNPAPPGMYKKLQIMG